jgi:hypothetical protein
MPRSGSKRVQVAFTAGRLTHFGGVYLLHQFLQHMKLRTFFHGRMRINERNNSFSVTERLMALVYPMILGLNSIELITLFGRNGVFQYLTGLPRVPNPTTLRRFLVQKADMLLPRLRAAHDELRTRFLSNPLPYARVWLDFDSTAKTLYGHQEGVAKGYNPAHKGKRSYHPLICTEAHTSDCLGGELRYGNVHTAAGVSELFRRILSLLPSSVRTIRVRADAGFYDGDFTALLRDNRIGFVLVAHMTRPLREKVARARYSPITAALSIAEFRYQPIGWDKPCRFVALREKLTEDRQEQLKLFTLENYAYHCVVSNLPLSPYKIFEFYENRSGVERIVRTLKEDYPFSKAPTNGFTANALYTELSLLSYNVVSWFKRLCLPDDWQSYTIPTLRHRILLVPGVFTRTNNRPRLKLPRNTPYQEVFSDAQKKIKELRPLA